jgi:hypothetical protein
MVTFSLFAHHFFPLTCGGRASVSRDGEQAAKNEAIIMHFENRLAILGECSEAENFLRSIL